MSAAEMLAGAAPRRAPDWHSIEWKKLWRTVRRLQAGIMKAVAEGRWNKVKALVYLLTHSYSGRALAILRVVSNSGAKTPGVDGVLWNTPEAKSAAFSTLRRHGYQPQPLRRVPHIPKSNGKRRGLGIPTMATGPCKHSTCSALIPSRRPWPMVIPMAFGGSAAVLMRWHRPTSCSVNGTVPNGFSKGTSKPALTRLATNGSWRTSPWTSRC